MFFEGERDFLRGGGGAPPNPPPSDLLEKAATAQQQTIAKAVASGVASCSSLP
jgi:hypothetical protein